jgi:hypothetical protein
MINNFFSTSDSLQEKCVIATSPGENDMGNLDIGATLVMVL